MARKKNRPQAAVDEGECICGMGEMLSQMFGAGNVEGVKVIRVVGVEEGKHKRGCKCEECRKNAWIKKGGVIPDADYSGDDGPEFVLKLAYHDQVEKLIALRKKRTQQQTNLVFWKSIVEGKDSAAFAKLSDDQRNWLYSVAVSAKQLIEHSQKTSETDEILKYLQRVMDFVELMAGRKVFKHPLLNNLVREVCTIVLVDCSQETQKEIAELRDKLPPELRDATNPPEIRFPLGELLGRIQSSQPAKRKR